MHLSVSIHEVGHSVLVQLRFDLKSILTNTSLGKRNIAKFSERAALHWLCLLFCHIFPGTATDLLARPLTVR